MNPHPSQPKHPQTEKSDDFSAIPEFHDAMKKLVHVPKPPRTTANDKKKNSKKGK